MCGVNGIKERSEESKTEKNVYAGLTVSSNYDSLNSVLSNSLLRCGPGFSKNSLEKWKQGVVKKSDLAVPVAYICCLSDFLISWLGLRYKTVVELAHKLANESKEKNIVFDREILSKTVRELTTDQNQVFTNPSFQQ